MLLMGCGDDTIMDTDGDITTVTIMDTDENTPTTGYNDCGNHIVEPGEECESNLLPCSESEPGKLCESDLSACKGCHVPRMIFISSSVFTATYIGLQNLDQICTDEAIKANINTNKTWKAWISKNEMSIKDHIYNSPGLYVSYLGIGDIIAYSFLDLTDGSINNPIIYDSNGIEQLDKDIWTGTLTNGSYADGNCDNWTSDVGEFGTVGKTNTITADWTNTQDLQDCANRKHIYCVEDQYIH